MVNEARARKNLDHAIDLIFFEQWLRFYFLTIKSGPDEQKLVFCRVPEEVCACLEEELPEFYPLARLLNNRELDNQASLAALSYCMINSAHAPNSEQWAQVLCGPQFRVTLHLMHCWLQSHEEELDAVILSFTAWRDKFLSWVNMPEVKNYAAGLRRELDEMQAGERSRLQVASEEEAEANLAARRRLQ